MRNVIAALVLLAVCGCNDVDSVRTSLPPNATNIDSLGNGWYTFDLTVDGVERKFMCQKSAGNHPQNLVELRFVMPESKR